MTSAIQLQHSCFGNCPASAPQATDRKVSDPGSVADIHARVGYSTVGIERDTDRIETDTLTGTMTPRRL